jgi:hypothetical protein
VALLSAYLPGAWSVTRVINGGADGFTGSACFEPDGGGGMCWRERGRLRLGGYDGEARRTYLIVPDGDAWLVRFDDGRPFHSLQLSGGRAEAEHLCGPDVYRGVYELRDEDSFTVVWTVSGPGRADTISSVYRRAARRSPSARTSA